MSLREVMQKNFQYAQGEDKTVIQSIEIQFPIFKQYKNKQWANNGEQSEATTKNAPDDTIKTLYLQLCLDQKRMSQNQMKLIEKQENQNPKLQSEIMELNQKLQTQNDMQKQQNKKLQTKVQNLTKQQQQSQVELNKLKMQVKQIQQKFENEYNPQNFAKQKHLKEQIINLKNNNKNLEEKNKKLSEWYSKETKQNAELKIELLQYYQP